MICHHHACVFVHIPKTAGISIEHVFLDRLGLTWQTRAPLLLRPNDRPELGPPYLAHLKAQDYVNFKYVTQDQFDSYYKFSFVRNPWDRAVSMYKYYLTLRLHFAHAYSARDRLGSLRNYWLYAGKHGFQRFLVEQLSNDMWKKQYWFVGPQYEFLVDDDGNELVDFVGRYEHLQHDFARVCARTNLPPTQLPHKNKSELQPTHHRPGPAHAARWLFVRLGSSQPFSEAYTSYYDQESADLVRRLYRHDIQRFGYKFGG